MKKENIIIGAIAAIGLLTVINSVVLFTSKPPSKVIPTPANQASTHAPHPGHENEGINNPAVTPLNPQQQAMEQAANMPKTSIKFDKMKHEFGDILQNTKNEYSFTFRNTGVEPLVISNAQGSCGCTVPNYPKEPILPGETGKIDVVYSPGKQQGNQTKTVTITANTEPAQTRLNITANVSPDPNAPQPVQTQPQTIEVK